MGGGISAFSDMIQQYGLSLEDQKRYGNYYKHLSSKGMDEPSIRHVLSKRLETEKSLRVGIVQPNGPPTRVPDARPNTTDGQSRRLRRTTFGDASIRTGIKEINSPADFTSTRDEGITSKNRGSVRRPSVSGVMDCKGTRCEICDINFSDVSMMNHHLNFSKQHAEKAARLTALGEGSSTISAPITDPSDPHLKQNDEYQKSVDKLKLQSDVSRSTHILSAFFQVNPRSPFHSYGDESVLLLRGSKTLQRSEHYAETVDVLVYLLSAADIIKSNPLHCPIVEVIIQDISSQPKHLGSLFVSFPSIAALLEEDVLKAFKEFQVGMQKKTRDLSWSVDDNAEKRIQLDLIAKYMMNHIDVQKDSRTATVSVVLKHESAQLGDRLNDVLQKMMGGDAGGTSVSASTTTSSSVARALSGDLDFAAVMTGASVRHDLSPRRPAPHRDRTGLKRNESEGIEDERSRAFLPSNDLSFIDPASLLGSV